MTVVNTNIGASIAQSALVKNQRALDSAMEQLSTGRKINSAADDAAGLAITTRMTSQINGLNIAVKNANDAIGMVNTAEGAFDEMSNMLQRMRELALQAANGTTDVKDRTYLNQEYQALALEIDRIADNTEWNGRVILTNAADGTSSSLVEFQVGVDTGQTVSVDFGNFTNVAGSGTFLHFSTAGAAGTISATTTAAAQTTSSAVIVKIDTAIDAINSKRATLGAASNRLTYAVDNLTNTRINAEASRSAILDTDYAQSTSELAKAQIIAQAGTAMLAQANQLPQTVLALLQ
jgi:flagellin